ncbi:hypothetical protein H0H87_010535, partial [Tephrocybe sp. NHM501043]
SSLTPASHVSSGVSNPSVTPPPEASNSTVSLLSILIKTARSSITVSLSTVTTLGSGSTATSFESPQASISPPEESTNKRLPIAIIIGTSVGGGLLIIAVLTVIIICRLRRRRLNAPGVVEPLIDDTREESSAAATVNTNGTAGNSTTDITSAAAHAVLESPTEEQLRQMVRHMSQRILALEESQAARDWGGVEEAPAPPDYSDVGGHSSDRTVSAQEQTAEAQRGIMG